VPEASPDANDLEARQAWCKPVWDGWCPGGTDVKYVPSLGGCYVAKVGACLLNRRIIGGPYAKGCHTVKRGTGRCGDAKDYVWVPALGGCRWTERGRCPGGENIVWVK
jgi:hypothetical protein